MTTPKMNDRAELPFAVLLVLVLAAPGLAMNDPATGRWLSRDTLFSNRGLIRTVQTPRVEAARGSQRAHARLNQNEATRLFQGFQDSPTNSTDPSGLACDNPQNKAPVAPGMGPAVFVYNLFSPYDVDIWSEADSCTQASEELRGCLITGCHQRCKWSCSGIRLCFRLDLPDGLLRCCARIGDTATTCSEGWVPCLIGNVFLFSCDVGLHDMTPPSHVGVECNRPIDRYIDQLLIIE